MNIIDDAKTGIARPLLEKISLVEHEYGEPNINSFIKDIRAYVQKQVLAIKDAKDLDLFQTIAGYLLQLLGLFHNAANSRSSAWALPLIRQCYIRLGLDPTKRTILIIHHDEVDGYSVYSDIIGIMRDYNITNHKKTLPIDIFNIPRIGLTDLGLISLIGHECGHVYIQQNVDISNLDGIDDYIEEVFENCETAAGQGDLFDECKIPYAKLIENERRKFRDRLSAHIEEYFCDFIGRVLLGPAFDIALIKLLSSDESSGSNSHPPEANRVKESLDNLSSWSIISSPSPVAACIESIHTSLTSAFNPNNFRSPLASIENEVNDAAIKLANQIQATEKVKLGTIASASELSVQWDLIEPELRSFRPPIESTQAFPPPVIQPIYAVIVSSLYFYGEWFKGRSYKDQIFEGHIFYKENRRLSEQEKTEIIKSRLSEHLAFSISIFDSLEKARAHKQLGLTDKPDLDSTVWALRTRVEGGKDAAFIATPNFDPMSQYGTNSVDLRLGSHFLIHRPPRYTHIQPNPNEGEAESFASLAAYYQDAFVPFGRTFILHPHQFVLAGTLEFIALPYDYYALVLGRSTWGRLGLNIATATAVQAGFLGCLTLELRNLGETPLPLTVGARIAQLCLIPVPHASTGKGYLLGSGRYIVPTKPEVPSIRDDKDWELLKFIRTT